MRDFNYYTCQSGHVHLMQLQGLWRYVMVLLAVFLFSGTAFAQFPSPDRCVSKDSEIVRATLVEEGQCNDCKPGTQTTLTLKLGIINKTGSERTSFAYWGTLEEVNDQGIVVKTSTVKDCMGPIPPNGTIDKNSISITYTCGNALRITNIYLAWTDASETPKSTCPLDESKIAPKCGTADRIDINVGLDLSATKIDVACYGASTGAIYLSVTGGATPYSYAWTATNGGVIPNGQANGQDLSGLKAGTYSVTVTDAKGCTTTASVAIKEPAAVLSATAAGDDVLCKGGTTTVTVSASGGTAPYTGTGEFTVSAGTHTYTITDANGCTTTASVAIKEPNQLLVSASGANPTCENLSGGSISGVITGGTAPYKISVNGFTNFVTSTDGNYTIPGLSAGSYTVVVRDANYFSAGGCEVSSSLVALIEPTCNAFAGCTPGFWKNWPQAWGCGYVPTGKSATKFFSVFSGINKSKQQGIDANITMFSALDLGGGGYNSLARAATAALLNACHQGVGYPYTEAEIKTAVVSMFNTGSATLPLKGLDYHKSNPINGVEALAQIFDAANNAGCPLDNSNFTATSSSALKGIEILEGTQLTAYPTPFADKATIEFRFVKDENYTINLYDMKGCVVKQLKAGTARVGEVNQVEVDGRSLPEGLYIARMMSDSGVKTVKLLLKKQ